MKGSEAKFEWYFLCTTLNGWIAFTWITFLANETSTEDEAQMILMAVPYLTVSCIAVLASLARQAFFVLVTNSAGCFLATFFMISTTGGPGPPLTRFSVAYAWALLDYSFMSTKPDQATPLQRSKIRHE